MKTATKPNQIKMDIPAAALEGGDEIWEAIKAGDFPNDISEIDGYDKLSNSQKTGIVIDGATLEDDVTVGDAVWDELTTPDGSELDNPARALAHIQDRIGDLAMTRSSNPLEEAVPTFEVVYDKDSGHIVSGRPVTKLPMDRVATARGEQISKNAPSGPKKNQSSFRTHPKNIRHK